MKTVLLAVAFAGTACHRGAPTDDDLVREAQDQTRTFFSLAEGGDCEQLTKLLARPESCHEFVHEMQETHTHLTSIDGARIDGRDPHMVLVSVHAQAGKLAHAWVVHAKWTADGWKVSM